MPSTRWPGDYHGYEIPGRGLHLVLEKGARVDYLTIRGDFEGSVYRGLDIAEPPKDQALLALKSPGAFLRQKLDKPLASAELSFFSKPQTQSDKADELGRRFWSQPTCIYELGLFRVAGPSEAIAQDEATLYCFFAQPFAPQDKWIRWVLQSQYEPADRGTSRLAEYPAKMSELPVARLAALRHTHWFVPPSESPTPVAGLRLRLFPRTLAQPTRVRVQVRDPVDISRLMLDLDLRLESQAADATLDLQDFIIPAGQPLWLTLTPEHEMELLPTSRVDVLTRPLDEVRVEHVRNLLNYAKDRFIHVSEPRPWGHVPLRECGERLLAFRQLNLPLEDLRRNAPKDDKVFGLWTWTHPKENPPLDWLHPPMPPGAPRWAVFQKEAAKLYRAFALWWIENRQLPNGLFGSKYGDDTDLVNDWLSLGLLNDNDGRIRDSVRRLADYCWTQGPILKGINRVHTDTLHAYEEGVNTQPILAQLHYGNPVYLERLMETSRTVRDELTYELPGGRRFFKACWYGATHIDTEYERGRDILANALLLHPTLYLAYYSRNPGAVTLLKQWAGTWCDLQTQALPKGPFPTSAQHPTGQIVGTTDRFVTGYGYQDVCLGMYAVTGEDKYATPMRTWADFGSFSFPTAEDWLAVRDLPAPSEARQAGMSAYRDQIVESAETIDWTPLDPAMGDDRRTLRAYMAWQLTGKKSYVETALENSYKRIAVLFPMHTWAEQSADRVAVSKTLVDRLYLGGTPGYRNKLWPTHTVSWEGFSAEFAAWVLQTKPDALRVWLYNFEPKPQQGRLRVWGLDNGDYEVTLGPDANQDETPDRPLWKRSMPLARNVAIPLELPSR
ncbi:MAG: hypothetical protein FJ279_26430, partial [Planctomycetes bacterium]|nr:hypothetical protein [Planctomycetota bacterium]